MATTAIRPTLGTKWIYAIGQFGWSLTSFAVFNLLALFYFPKEDGTEVMFPDFINTGAILGVLTTLGLISFGGRIFDAFTDPMIANWSDRTKHRLGKRKFFMALAILPFALFSVLVFIPPSTVNLAMNTTWLFVTLFLFYLAMTLYVVPYTALISELGHHEDDRLSISTIISITWALGFLIGNTVHAIHDLLTPNLGSVKAFQYIVIGFSSIGLLAMLVPILFLNEKKYALQKVTTSSVWHSIKTVFKNKNFRFFASADLFYWLSLTFIQMGVSYFVSILMGRSSGDATLFMTVGFLGSFLFYIPIMRMVKKIGKKKMLLAAFLIFGLIFLTTANYSLIGNSDALFYSLAILSAFPLATFGILPNAIIADIVFEKGEDGAAQSGMFYAARNFTMKLGIALANLIFPSLLVLGKNTTNPWGVELVAYAAFLFCIVGMLVFLGYRGEEKGVRNELGKD